MALDEQIDDPALQPLTAFNADSGGGSALVTQRVSAPPSPTPQREEDDPALRPLGAFNYSGSTPYTPAPTWHGSDIGHGLAAGFHTGIGAPLAEITGQTEEGKAEREAGAASEAAMTPGAEQTTPVWLAEQAAPAALIMGSAAIPGVGPIVGAGVGAALQGGSAISGNKASIESANDADLMESNPQYAADRHSGLTENQAKEKLGSSQALSVGLPSAALGAVAGLAGGAELTGFLKMGVGEAETAALTGKGLMAPAQKVIGNRATNVITGAGRELAVQGGVGAAQEGISKHADAQAGVGAEATPEEMLTSGVGQGLFGAGMFGALGGWRGGTKVEDLGKHTRELTQTPDQATIARAPQDQGYRKPEAQVTAPVDINTPPENKVAVAPTAANKGVGPSEAAALNPDAATPKAPEVTQGVTKPPAETVIPPKVVQPKEPPPTINREAPPAGDTTSPQGTPQPPPEPQPLPRAAPPVEDAGSITPEPQASLAEQHAQLLDPANDREAMLYPKGEQPIELTDKKGFGQVKLPDGRIVQFDKSGPSGFTVAKIRQYAKDDRLNEALQLGPVTKTEALQRMAAGEPGTVTTERTPDGAEVKGAVGTEATAPLQEAHLDAAKTPGNTVQTEDVAANHADQLARVQAEIADRKTELDAAERGEFRQPQEQVVQPQVVEPVTPRVTQTPFGPGRVLDDTTPEGIRARDAAAADDARQAQTVADQLRAKEAAKQEAVETKRVHTAKTVQAKIAGDNIAAKRISDAHPAPPVVDNVKRPTEVYKRAEAMVKDAKASGIDIPKAFPEGHPHSPAMLKLREAADLTSKKEPKWEAYARFLDREKLIDAGKGEEVFAARRNEGALGQGAPEGATEEKVIPKSELGTFIHEAETPEKELIAKEEGEGEGGEHEEAHEEGERAPDALAAAREERDRKITERRAESEALRKEAPAPKAAVGFQAVKVKNRSVKRAMMEEEGEEPRAPVRIIDADGNELGLTPNRTSTAEEAIKEHYDPKAYDKETQQMHEHLIEGLNKYAGDTPTHYLSEAAMDRAFGKGVRGLYTEDVNGEPVIFLAEGADQQTAIHEALHAATAKAFDSSPEFRELMRRLHEEVENSDEYKNLSGIDDMSIGYPMSNPEEFLVGMMTNPKVQRLLKQVKISPELARAIGIPKWRKMTGWHAALHMIQKALGLGPRDVSAIEAAMSISQQAMWMHPRAGGDLMEAMARGDRARDAEEIKPAVSLSRLRFSKEDPHESLTEGEAPARWASEADKATSKLKEIVRSLPVAGRVATAGLRHLIETPRDWVQRAKDNKWGIHDAANHWANEMGAQSATRERILKISTPVMDRLMAFQHNPKTAAEFKELGKLFISSTIHGADARDDLGVGKNEHIDPAPEDRKGNAAPENAPKEHWEAIKGSPEDRKAYKALSPEGRKLYNDTMDELSAMHDRETAAGRQALIDGVQNSLTHGVSALSDERKAAIQKVLDGNELTKEERAEHGDDDSIKAIHDYDVMTAKSKRGAYFPLDHGDGSHVVEGEHDYKIPEGATRFSENPNSPDYHRILFDNKKDALAFEPKGAAGNPLPVDHYTVEGEHHAVVNPREVQFVDGQGEGERVRAHMLAPADQGGMGMDPKKVAQVQPRKNQEVWRQSQNANLVREQIKRLDKMTDLTDSDRERMTDAIKHVAASSMPGSRLRSTMLERDRTGGAGKDILRDLDKYRRRSAAAEASAKHRPAIDKAMQDMHEWADDNKGHADAGAIRQMVNMFDKRTSGSNTDEAGDPGTNRRWAAVQAYNALEGLVTPAFHLLHQLHVPLTVAPDLAAESSVGDASRILTSMYGRMGGRSVGQAFKGMGNALRKGWQYDFKPTNFIDTLTHEMKMTPSERETLQWQLDHDTIQHTGMDFSHANASSSGLAQATARMRNFSGEFLGSADATNKVVSMLAYHQLGLEKGLSGEKLHQYVADGIIRTQGQFAGWNKSGAFQSPMARALLQYKQYPIKLMNMHAKAMYNSFAPTQHPTTGKWGYHAADWETRARALKVFGYMTLAAGAMSGVRGAVTWPIRLADDLGEKLGLTDGYQAHMDELQRGIAGQFGTNTADTLMNGLGAPFGLNIGHRGSISDPLGLSYALETMGKDPDASIFKWMAGAPGSTVHNVFSAADAARQGDVASFTTHLLPRLIGDPIKGWQQANSGVVSGKKTLTPPVSIPQSVLKGIGFQNITETNAHEVQDLQKQEATDKAAAVQSGNYSGWNHAHPHNPIKVQDMLRAKAAAAATKQGKPKPKTAKELELEKEYSVYQ